MALGLPSKEEMRDYLISKGMDPEMAEARAAQAERTNTRQALTTMGTQGAGAAIEGAGALAGGNIFQRAMQAIRGLDTAGTKQLMRTSTGQMRNVAANAPTLIRTAEGQIIKLAPGQAVPAGATVLNVAEAPVASIIGGGAVAAGTPVALAYQRGEKGEVSTASPQDSGMYVDPASGMSMGAGNPIVEAAMERAREAQAAARRPPIDDVESQYVTMGRAPPGGDYNDVFNVPYTPPTPDRPVPRVQNAGPARSANVSAAPQQAAAQTEQPWYSRIFSGPQYQSTGQEVIQRSQNMPRQGEDRPMTRLNWGDSDSAADFFRADRARQELEKNKEEFTGMNRGGSAGGGHGKDATIMKALEIIHHMLRTR